MTNYKYSGRIFSASEFKFIDFNIGLTPRPALAKLKTGEPITVVSHPVRELEGIWAELVPADSGLHKEK